MLEESSCSEEERTDSIKRSRVVWNSDTEDDALPTTSTMSFDEVVDRASSSKKKNEKQKKAKKN